MEKKTTEDKLSDMMAALRSVVSNFQPSFSARTGGSIIAPSVRGSYIENFNISVTTTAPEEPSNNNEETKPDFHTENHSIKDCQQKLKASLKQKFHYIREGMTNESSKVSLNSIYTELYIIEGGRGEVNKEHEVRQIEALSKTNMSQEESIQCNSLFEPQKGQEHPIRTVLTRGVAGIGKTVLTNKFTLDWTEDKANTNFDFVFPLCFRELNSMRNIQLSLVELLDRFFPQMKDLILKDSKCKMLFILDGLDESRVDLDFQNCEIMHNVREPNMLGVLLVNLIRGRLLPMALIWITSRPAASSQIPAEHIDLVTEVRGFNNPQKDEYFRRKILDQSVANQIISHVKSCRSLHIMCHIPVFCWLAANVLVKITNFEDLPKTLTQMFLQFLSYISHTMKNRMPRPDLFDNIQSHFLAFGKLAFKELEKGNLVFYERDLKLNGIDVGQASMFSGIYTEIFNEEPAICGEKMFCFVHLSIHEFFAALYVFLMFHNENTNVLIKKSSASRRFFSRGSSELILYKEAIEKALQCPSGHYDIFLRFLLGLLLEANHQTFLRNFLITNRTHPNTRTEIIKHIKERIHMGPPPDRCVNLFHCLNELNDRSLVEEIQSYICEGSLNRTALSASQWASLVFVLLTSEEELKEFELKNYSRSEEGLMRMQQVVKAAQVANLSGCNLTVNCCKTLSNVISSSQIQELDLSHNHLTDTGLVMVCSGIKDSKIVTLRVKSCSLTKHSAEALSSVLSSATCQLKDLDLFDNDFGNDGVQKLCEGLGSPHCKLHRLNLSLCRVSERGCTFLASALNSSRLKELDLSHNHPGSSGLQLLTALQEDPLCTLERLSVEQCGPSRIEPGPKIYAVKLTLDPDTAQKHLSLSNENRKATRDLTPHYPNQKERFDFWAQVLCTQGLTGRCYWEVQWDGRGCIGAAYEHMPRKGEEKDSKLGQNDLSWGLNFHKDGYKAVHRGAVTGVAAQVVCDKLGVYLDWFGGRLSFFSISDDAALTPIHTFKTNFTDPVYPAFHLGWVGSSIYLC